MKSTIRNIKGIRFQYIIFIVTVIVTILATQFIIQYDLNKQDEDAQLLNISGRQRMLSQRIAKLMLYIRQDLAAEKNLKPRLDTLGALVTQWEKIHNSLRNGSREFGLKDARSPRVDSLLAALTPHLLAISSACRDVIRNPTKEVVANAVSIIEDHELQFLWTMELTVTAYEREAERKLDELKNIERLLAFLSIAILLMEFVFIFLPMIRSMRNANHVLSELNNELTATEEELRSNLDYVSTLQDQVSLSEKKFREVVEHATEMIYELDEHGRFTYVNPVMETICEYTKEELGGKQYFDLVHADYQVEVINFYRRQRSSKVESTYHEFPIITKNGFEVWVGQNVKMFFENGWVTKVSVVARDITVLYKAREALIASEELFRSLSENAPVGIFQLDASGKPTFVNNKFFDIVGIDRFADQQKRREAIHAEDRERVVRAWNLAIENHESLSMQFRYATKKGITWVHNEVHPLKKYDGTIAGFVGTLSDITPIVEAKQVAEAATKAKSQFLSMMSHEIRTPMNAIIGLTNLLIMEKPRPDQHESLRLLKFSGENLLTIINDILDFSKIEAGKVIIEQVDFSLKPYVLNIVQLLENRAKDKAIRLTVDYDPNLPQFVKGDPTRIGQVLTNIIGNAIKFTEKGGVDFSVKHLGTEDNHVQIRFTIRDSGIGIEEEKIKQVFESFSQASTDTTRKFGGTGLGLSITKNLLKLMGSEIEVSSIYGQGSTFAFTLRLEVSDERQSTPVKKASTDFSKKNIKILLVEDNRVNQIVAGNFLKKWGIKYDCANNGKEALELIKSKAYHLVLMDLQMPELDGYQATREIRSWKDDPYFTTVPILALTASAMGEVTTKVTGVGMNDYISKPFHPDDLEAKLSQYIDIIQERKPGINLDLYTEGDPDFKRELAGLLIKNIVELQQALEKTLQSKDPEIFRAACHKVKTTIGMLGDDDYSRLVEELRQLISLNPAAESVSSLIGPFTSLSEKIVAGLQEEINRI